MNPYTEFLNMNNSRLTWITEKGIFEWISKLCIKNNIIPNKSTVMDLGSGHGDNSIILSKHFNTVLSIDPSTKMLEYSKKLIERIKKIDDWFGSSRIKLYKGDFSSIKFKNIDVICMFNSIHFSKNMKSDLDNIFSNLKKGGLLIIKEPFTKFSFGPNISGDQLDKKIKHLKKARKELKVYFENNKYKILLDIEIDTSYRLIVKNEIKKV